MITRFRVEASEKTRDGVIDKLTEAVACMIGFSNNENPVGEWECTQDVVTGVPGLYRGRMVMKFHTAEEIYELER